MASAQQPWPRKAATLLVATAAAAAVWGGVASVIALAGLDRLDPRVRIERVIPWFWHYRNDQKAQRWMAIGAMGATVLGVVGVLAVARRRPPPLHGAARWATSDEVAKAGLRDKDGVILGSHGGRLLRSGSDEHVLVCAPTRAGKSAGVVIPTLLSWSGGAVVLDIKHEVYNATAGWRAAMGHQVLLFDPLNEEDRTARFNPLDAIDRANPAHAYDAVHRIAVLLFPERPAGEAFWTEAARSAFVGVTLFVAQSPSLPFTLGEVARQFASGNLAERLTRSAEARRGSGAPLTATTERLIADFCRSSDSTFASIRQSVSTRLALWLNPRIDAATAKSDFTLRDLRSRPIALYLAAAPADLERIAPLYALVVQQLLEEVGRVLPASGDERRLLVMLDEFASLGRAPMLARSFSWVAGYGVRLVCVVQTLAQLKARYGADAAEITANCGVQAYFTPATLQDARELSELLGAHGQEAVARMRPAGFAGGAGNITKTEQRRPLLLPHELLELDRETILIVPRGRPPVQGRRLLWRDVKAFSSRWRPPPIVEPGPLIPEPPVEVARTRSAPTEPLSPDAVDFAERQMNNNRDLFNGAWP